MNLAEKTINFLGDSITEGAGADSSAQCYVSLLQKSACFAEVRNYGIGGTCIAPNRVRSLDPKWDQDFCGRADQMVPADLIVIFGGTNDYGHGDAPLGEVTDTSSDTFCGAYHTLLERLHNQYPDAALTVVTPLHRFGEDDPRGEGMKQGGRPLREYVDRILAIAARHQVPVLNLYDHPPFPADEEYLADGLHPNARGHAALAQTFLEYFQKQ